MILILRGHIRNSFETTDLYNFVEQLRNLDSELKIYIHTWNVYANNISWRQIDSNNTTVNDDTIKNYFGKLNDCIKHIIIDDDSKIELIGDLSGNINNGPMPIIGWKNYWYGKYRIVDYLYQQSNNFDEMIINCRFDIFNNSNSLKRSDILNFIINNIGNKFTKNAFIYDFEYTGIDNIYLGNITTMYKLTNIFFYHLDLILLRHNDTENQEKLVYRINLNHI
jgi:hypothetical protein